MRGGEGSPRNRWRTRWLAEAEVDHGGHDTSRGERGARARRRSFGREGSRRARIATQTNEPGRAKTVFGRVARGHGGQTKTAESEAVSGDRTRPPQTKWPP